jgi:hypothetical protein
MSHKTQKKKKKQLKSFAGARGSSNSYTEDQMSALNLGLLDPIQGRFTKILTKPPKTS